MDLFIDIDDDDDDEDHDDDDNEDDDDVTTTRRLQVWVEVGGGTDVDVCYEVSYWPWCFYRSNCEHSLGPCSDQGSVLLTSLEELTYLLHTTLAPRPLRKFFTGKRY